MKKIDEKMILVGLFDDIDLKINFIEFWAPEIMILRKVTGILKSIPQ